MWERKKLMYDICIPPISKSFESFSNSETDCYFKWYLSKVPQRVSYLSKKCSEDLCINEDKINFSPESLLMIWKWFLSMAKTEKTESQTVQLDLQTEYIVRDIGMFLGEMFNSNYENINWSYYESPKTDFFVNRPVLIGFKDYCVSPPFDAVFEPIHMVRVQACKIITNQQNEDDLLKLYNIWAKMI